ncbi:MAG: hypothetical protein DWI10_03030 [Planctomycetota bacterium]|nr:MAG: hypothetical protein DWI10_03030 [Planctomycetota bacterium]
MTQPTRDELRQCLGMRAEGYEAARMNREVALARSRKLAIYPAIYPVIYPAIQAFSGLLSCPLLAELAELSEWPELLIQFSALCANAS